LIPDITPPSRHIFHNVTSWATGERSRDEDEEEKGDEETKNEESYAKVAGISSS
jgi:hypothetical protein